MAGFIRDHPVAFWSAAIVFGVLVLSAIVLVRSRDAQRKKGKAREVAAAVTFLVVVIVPALVALLVAGLLPASLWRIASVILPTVAVLVGFKYWQRLQIPRRRRSLEKKHAE
jgi:glucan phosphoethanolaminetransferase (alkaline phosphatase superfamily)